VKTSTISLVQYPNIFYIGYASQKKCSQNKISTENTNGICMLRKKVTVPTYLFEKQSKKLSMFFFAALTSLFFATSVKSQSCDQFIKLGNGNLVSANQSVGFAVDQGKIGFDESSNIYVTGKDDYFLSKFDSLGNPIWNKTKASSIASDLVVSGSSIFVTSKEALLSKYDQKGNEIFQSIKVANAIPMHMVADGQSNIYITGQISTGTSVTFGSNTYTTLPSLYHLSYFIVKYNSSGQLQWSKHIKTNTTYFQPVALAIFKGSLYVNFGGQGNVQAGTVSFNITSPLESKDFIYKTNTDGVDSWIRPFSYLKNMSNDMEVNSQGNLVLSGSGGFLNCDTALNLATYTKYPFLSGGLEQSISIYNDYYASISLLNLQSGTTQVIITGKMSNPTASKTILLNIPSQNLTNRYLLEFSPKGSLYGFFHTNGAIGDTAFVDMAAIPTNSSSNMVIVKFNASSRLLSGIYTDKAIDCGGTVVLGSDLVKTPYIVSNIPRFSWKPTNGLSNPNSPNPSCSINSSQKYTLSIDSNCTKEVNVVVTNPSNFTYQTNGMVATFSVNNPSCTSFLWDFGNGNTSSINPNPIVTYLTPGTYGVCLKCNDQPATCVRCLNITVPSNTSGTAVGQDQVSLPQTRVYPNPAGEQLTIENKSYNSSSFYEISNQLGQQILLSSIVSEKTEIDLRPFSKGLYFIKISDGSGNYVQKIVIQ